MAFQTRESQLRSAVRDLQERLQSLKLFDKTSEIHAYCDDLESEVILCVESAVQHMHEIKQELLKKISDYRDELTTRTSSISSDAAAILEEKFVSLSNEVADYNEQCSAHLNNGTEDDVSDELMRECQKQTSVFTERIRDLGVALREQIFNNRFMKFKRNPLFLIEYDHIGGLEYSASEIDRNDVTKAESRFVLEEHPICEFRSSANPVFLSNGHLAFQDLFSKSIRVKDLKVGKDVCSFQSRGSICSLAELPNGGLASGDYNGNISLWDIGNARLLRTFNAHSTSVRAIRGFPNGILASLDAEKIIKIWNIALGHEPILLQTFADREVALEQLETLSNDYLVTCSRCSSATCLLIWNPSDGRIAKRIRTNVSQVTSLCTLDDDRIAIGDSSGTLRIFSLFDDIPLKNFRTDMAISFVKQLGNGNLLLASHTNNEVHLKILDANFGQPTQNIVCHAESFNSLSLSKDSRVLATGCASLSVKVWSLLSP